MSITTGLHRSLQHDPDAIAEKQVTATTLVPTMVRMMLGYWCDDAATKQVLRGGWMHTGDAGYMDRHGYVYLVDRIKDMIVSGGENVYSAEVESVIQQHGAIASCAVVGVPDDYWGDRVHAVLVLKPGANLTADELREFVSESVARSKAPRSIDIVDELPLSPAGKILKRELRARYRS